MGTSALAARRVGLDEDETAEAEDAVERPTASNHEAMEAMNNLERADTSALILKSIWAISGITCSLFWVSCSSSCGIVVVAVVVVVVVVIVVKLLKSKVTFRVCLDGI